MSSSGSTTTGTLGGRGSLYEVTKKYSSRNSYQRFLHSSNNAEDADNQASVETLLDAFVTYFVKEFESKLLAYHLILEGEVKKGGKFSDEYSGRIGKVFGGVAGGIVGTSFGHPEPGATLGASIFEFGFEKLASYVGTRQYKKRLANLSYIVEKSQAYRSDFRVKFVEIGFDIFQSFEAQFTRVTTNQGRKNAMHKLAKDGVDRVISHMKSHSEFTTQGVVLGKSKRQSPFVSLTAGHTLTYEFQSGTSRWKTSSLYEKAGVEVTENRYTIRYKPKGVENCFKYGFRRPFLSEKIDGSNEAYEFVERSGANHYNHQYGIEPEDKDLHTEKILERINLSDKSLDSPRIITLLKEVRIDIMNEVNSLKSTSTGFPAYNKLLDQISIRLKTLNIQYYLTLFCHNFHQIQLNQQSILNCVQRSRAESQAGFQEASQERALIANNIQDIKRHLCENRMTKESIWFNVIHPVKSFHGRGNELGELRNKFQLHEGSDSRLQSVVICGLGGVGKTELVRKYIADSRPYYSDGIWINAETPECFEKSILELARKLDIVITNDQPTVFHDLQETSDRKSNILANRRDDRTRVPNPVRLSTVSQHSSKDTRVAVNQVKRHFSLLLDETQISLRVIMQDVYNKLAGRQAVIVFDNVKCLSDIQQLLPLSHPNSENLSVLITSRNKDWEAGDEGHIEMLLLNDFLPEEAEGFIEERLGPEYTPIKDEVRELAETMHYFPLALKQATSTIRQEILRSRKRGYGGTHNVNDYIKSYQEETKRASLLNPRFQNKQDRYADTLYTTWKVTLNHIEEQGETGQSAVGLLNLMAYFDPDHIPVEVLFAGMPQDKESLWNAVELLERHSMVSAEHGLAQIHRLMQEVIKLRLREDGKEEGVLANVLRVSTDLTLEDQSTVGWSQISNMWVYASAYAALVHQFRNSTYGETRKTPLHLLAADGHLSGLEKLLGHFDAETVLLVVSAADAVGRTPLHYATLHDRTDIIKYLVETQAADVSIEDCNQHTPLHYAAYNGNVDSVQYFVEVSRQRVGAERDLQGSSSSNKVTNVAGGAPLHLAVARGHFSIVAYLVEQLCEVGVVDEYGDTPLHVAVACGYNDIVKYLVEVAGADILAKDNIGHTPVFNAAYYGHLDIFNYLRQQGNPRRANRIGWRSSLSHVGWFWSDKRSTKAFRRSERGVEYEI